MIKLVILDFDDTITNNHLLDYYSFKIICTKFNTYIPTKNEIKNLRMRNYTASEIIDYIVKRSNRIFDKKEFWKMRNRFLESKESINHVRLRPAVKIVLKKLKSIGLKLVIGSLRKRRSIITQILEKHGLLKYIDAVFLHSNKQNTRDLQVGYKIKKHLYRKILNNYKVNRKEIISIGDSVTDIKAAKYYGINHVSLHFDGDYFPRPKIKNHIQSFRDIYKLINRLNNK